MTKSTTGAHGDFPDYYYEQGNQFGTYLKGKTPKKSWDDRHEQALVGGHPVLSGERRPSGVPDATLKNERALTRVLAAKRLAENAEQDKRRAKAKARKRAQAKARRPNQMKASDDGERQSRLGRSSKSQQDPTPSAASAICAICRMALPQQQIQACLVRPVFMGHAYCEVHAAKMLAKLNIGNRE